MYVCVCMYALKTVSTDTILHSINTFIIINSTDFGGKLSLHLWESPFWVQATPWGVVPCEEAAGPLWEEPCLGAATSWVDCGCPKGGEAPSCRKGEASGRQGEASWAENRGCRGAASVVAGSGARVGACGEQGGRGAVVLVLVASMGIPHL